MSDTKLNTRYKYIHFERIDQNPKTAVYECINNTWNICLGVVRFYPRWRQYCFFPAGDCVMNLGCMTDIIHFIGQIEEGRKTKQKEGEG